MSGTHSEASSALTRTPPSRAAPGPASLSGPGWLGPRSLTTFGAVSQSLAIGPVFSVGFLAGTVAVFAGYNTPLSVLVAGLGIVGLAYTLVLYGRRFAGPGTVYEYLAGGLHSAVGIMGAGGYLFGLLLLGSGGVVAEGYLTNRLLRNELSVDLGWWFWALVALGLVIAANWSGVRVGIRAIVALAALSSLPFLVIAVAVIAKGGADGNSLAVFAPTETSWGAVFHGMLLAVALFIGFETAACLGEETKDPRRSIPVAMVAAVVVCLAFYLLVTYAGAVGFGPSALRHNAWFASGNPFGELGDRYLGGHALDWIVNLTVMLDLLSVLIAFAAASSRLIMTLARDRLLPRAVARTSSRFRTPVGGLAIVGAAALVVLAWTALAPFGEIGGIPDVLHVVLILSAAGSYLITLVYFLLAAGAPWLIRQSSGRGGKWWQGSVALVGMAVPVLAFDGALNPFPAYPNDIAVYLAGAAIGVSILWYAGLRFFNREAAPGVTPRATTGALE